MSLTGDSRYSTVSNHLFATNKIESVIIANLASSTRKTVRKSNADTQNAQHLLPRPINIKGAKWDHIQT